MLRMLPGSKVDDRPNTHAVAYYATTDQIDATYRQALKCKNGPFESRLFATSVHMQGCLQVQQYGLIYAQIQGQTNGNICPCTHVERYE